MYGPIPSITIEKFESPPPDRALKTPKNSFPPRTWLIRVTSTPGTGIEARRRKMNKAPTTKSTLFLRVLSVISVFIFLKNEFMKV